MSNAAQKIDTVLRHANGLERLAISAIIHHPRLPTALKRDEIENVLDEIREGGGGRRLKQFRIMSEEEFDPSTTILGFKSSIPVFVSGAGSAKLGHPLGEANITRGAYQSGIIQMVSSSPSLSYEEIVEASKQGQLL